MNKRCQLNQDIFPPRQELLSAPKVYNDGICASGRFMQITDPPRPVTFGFWEWNTEKIRRARGCLEYIKTGDLLLVQPPHTLPYSPVCHRCSIDVWGIGKTLPLNFLYRLDHPSQSRSDVCHYYDVCVNLRLSGHARKIQTAWRAYVTTKRRAAGTIQLRWRRCISDPSYVICRDRLTREFSTLLGG